MNPLPMTKPKNSLIPCETCIFFSEQIAYKLVVASVFLVHAVYALQAFLSILLRCLGKRKQSNSGNGVAYY